jgi:hypothetical protein
MFLIDSARGADGGGGEGGPGPALEACPQPSIDRITWWKATGEGNTVPMAEGTSLLVKEGDHYVARQRFVGNDWHVLEVLITNAFAGQVDLGASSGFWLTYNTTADLYVQMRPGFAYGGGDKWVTRIPSSAGQTRQQFFPFTASAWTTVSDLGRPGYPFAMALKGVRGLVFVGQTPNTIALSGLRIDGFVPTCR